MTDGSMIIYLYGEEIYRRREKERFILEEFKKKHSGLALDKFDLDDNGEEFFRLKRFLSEGGLFTNLKLSLVRNLSDDKESLDLLKKYLDNKETILILSNRKHLKKLDFLLKGETVKVLEFDWFDEVKFSEFIDFEVRRRSLVIDSKIKITLLRKFRKDYVGLINILERLMVEPKILDSDITPVMDFFPLLNKLKSLRLEERLKYLKIILENNDAAAVFNVIAATLSGEKLRVAVDLDMKTKLGKCEFELGLISLVI